MTGDAPDHACPNCGELDRESRGVVAGFEQPPRDYRDNLPGGKHITERLYRCVACGLEFSVVMDRSE